DLDDLHSFPTRRSSDLKFWWAFMMGLHFIGLVMIVGAVGALDLRMLGFAKEFPIAPMHRLAPWALAGFAINVTTGVLAFIGMPKDRKSTRLNSSHLVIS